MSHRISPLWWPVLAVALPILVPLLLRRNRAFSENRAKAETLNRSRIEGAERFDAATLRLMIWVISAMTVLGCSPSGAGRLPTKPTEDMSHLLKPPAVAAHQLDLNEPKDYRPDERVDWIIDVEVKDSSVLQRTRILDLFDTAWWEANGRPEIYGWSPETKHWTFPKAADVPETYSRLAFGWSLFDPLNKNTFRLSADDLNRYKRSLAEQSKELGQSVLRESTSPDEAECRVKRIATLVSDCDRDVTVVLAAPHGKKYQGRDVWDVMLCLGLQHGDGDLFHWHNVSCIGDDSFFSVWTSTPPGYLEPKWMVAGKNNVDDLVFGYSIPRSPDPLDVFDTMMKAVHYSQERLGGSLVDKSGKPLDEQAARKEIEHVVRKLKEAGLAPGEHATCLVF